MAGRAAQQVLVIEDEANILLSLRFVLEQAGYEVRTAASGREGLAELQRQRPDLLILDLMLPDVSGYELCQQVRADQELADIPVLVLTARAQQTERLKGIEVGATEYVTKPFRVSDLLGRVARLVEAGRPRS